VQLPSSLHLHRAIALFVFPLVLLSGTACAAQTQAAKTPSLAAPVGSKAPAARSGNSEQAQIVLKAATLEVVAQNAPLLPLLQRVAQATGMEIIGMPDANPRVSGKYGPDGIRTVLADLIAGAGYNFIMVGGQAQGAPARLLVENPGGEKTPPAIANPGVSPSTESTANDGVQPGPEPLGPGALRPTPADAPSDEDERIQRNLQRLQHIEEQQQSAPN
jgi:hypothetical protein